MVIQVVDSQSDIAETLFQCREDFYNQDFNNIDMIETLSFKFSKYAKVVRFVDEHKILGFAAYYINNTETRIAFLSMIIISNKYQGLGLGTELLNYIQSDCKNEKMEYLRLEVDLKNANAIRFYTRNSFLEESRNDKSIFMIKKIH